MGAHAGVLFLSLALVISLEETITTLEASWVASDALDLPMADDSLESTELDLCADSVSGLVKLDSSDSGGIC